MANGKFPNLGNFSLARYYQISSQAVKEETLSTEKLNTSPIMTRSKAKGQPPKTPATPTRPRRPKFLERVTPDRKDAGTVDSLPDFSALVLSPISPATGEFTNLTAIEDEQIVNSALLIYLNALTMHDLAAAEWSLSRRAFSLRNRSKDDVKVFEARVDGCLRSRRIDRTLAIIEVKPHVRYPKNSDKSVRLQEAGQLAAWISDEPPVRLRPGDKAWFVTTEPMFTASILTTNSRLMISQDRHEIYLNFATFDSKYVNYVQNIREAPTQPKVPGLKGKQPEAASPERSFLNITEYGPFDTRNKNHMLVLGQSVLAYSLELEAKHLSELSER